MKVPASNTAAAAAAPAQTPKTTETQTEKAQGAAPSTASAEKSAGSLQDRLQKDGFEGIVKGGCFPPIGGRPGETLDLGDRMNATGLTEQLSSPFNQVRVQLGEKDETITRGKDGSYKGPNGEPVAQVRLDDGTTAYVDPNTNQYYLTDETPNLFGQVQATGPHQLPEGAEFSNSHFSDADVKAVQRHAASGSPFDHKPFPWPPIDRFPPIKELPRLPIDPIMLTAADLKDGGQ